jgi:glutathionylspermidine synthase
MIRKPMTARHDLEQIAADQGFRFASMYGEAYWDETSAYMFRLQDVERHIEDPSTELHAMARAAVDAIVADERLMERMGIPHSRWDFVRRSWLDGEQELYGRFDLVWDGSDAPAKMLEYNADTPTSLFEAGSFQWSWLEDMRARGQLPSDAEQFNGLYEALTERFKALFTTGTDVHFASGEGSEEDYGTVEFMAYAAREAGLGAHHVFTDAIGLSDTGQLTDGEDRIIGALFKLHPWEDTLRADFSAHLAKARCRFLEPAWKALVSNKGILPVLWELFEGHPNLLPAFFEQDVGVQAPAYRRAIDKGLFQHGRVAKPLFSREGASITISDAAGGVLEASTNREYDSNPFIVQAYHPLPVFDGWRPIIGSWIVGETCAGMGIREDRALITQDLSRFKPHFLLG